MQGSASSSTMPSSSVDVKEIDLANHPLSEGNFGFGFIVVRKEEFVGFKAAFSYLQELKSTRRTPKPFPFSPSPRRSCNNAVPFTFNRQLTEKFGEQRVNFWTAVCVPALSHQSFVVARPNRADPQSIRKAVEAVRTKIGVKSVILVGTSSLPSPPSETLPRSGGSSLNGVSEEEAHEAHGRTFDMDNSCCLSPFDVVVPDCIHVNTDRAVSLQGNYEAVPRSFISEAGAFCDDVAAFDDAFMEPLRQLLTTVRNDEAAHLTPISEKKKKTRKDDDVHSDSNGDLSRSFEVQNLPRIVICPLAHAQRSSDVLSSGVADPEQQQNNQIEGKQDIPSDNDSLHVIEEAISLKKSGVDVSLGIFRCVIDLSSNTTSPFMNSLLETSALSHHCGLSIMKLSVAHQKLVIGAFSASFFVFSMMDQGFLCTEDLFSLYMEAEARATAAENERRTLEQKIVELAEKEILRSYAAFERRKFDREGRETDNKVANQDKKIVLVKGRDDGDVLFCAQLPTALTEQQEYFSNVGDGVSRGGLSRPQLRVYSRKSPQYYEIEQLLFERQECAVHDIGEESITKENVAKITQSVSLKRKLDLELQPKATEEEAKELETSPYVRRKRESKQKKPLERSEKNIDEKTRKCNSQPAAEDEVLYTQKRSEESQACGFEEYERATKILSPAVEDALYA